MADMWTLIGRLHVVAVHFPIALWLLFAGLCLHPRWRGRGDVLRPLGAWAAVSAVAAVVTGLAWLDGQSVRGEAAALLDRHRLAGLVTAALGLGAALLAWRTRAAPDAARPSAAPVVALGLLTAAGAGLTGHLGGLSVHGEDHYALETPAEVAAAALDGSGPTPDFDTQVWPVLKKTCVRCHGHRKQKGGLRLDSLAAARAGGESGKPALVPGDPARSELFRRVSLPHDHEDYMPSKGDPLDAAQAALLGRWIAAGAPWTAPLAPPP